MSTQSSVGIRRDDYIRNRRRLVADRAVRHRLWNAVVLLLVTVTLSSCDELPVEVSDTEQWLLELEQLTDGSEGNNPRRGTITMELRLNHTTQPDPTCAGQSVTDVTTFLASVELRAQRLADPGSGSLDASWNCHGFSGVVHLNDGRTFNLQSDEAAGVFSTMANNSWTGPSGSRGSFLLQPRDQIQYDTRQSHFDLIVENQQDDLWRIGLVGPLNLDVMGVLYDYNHATAFEEGETLRLVDVPAHNTVRLSWPSHQNQREGRLANSLPEFRIMHIRDDDGNRTVQMSCALGPDHPREVRLTLGPEQFDEVLPDCGLGWEGNVLLTVSRSPLFIQPGGDDTLTVLTEQVDALSAESPTASITTELDLAADAGEDSIWRHPLTVRVAPDAPRTEYGIVIRGEYYDRIEQTIILPISVYDLDLAPATDTLTIAPGARDTTSILLLDTDGVFGGIRFSSRDLPAGVLLTGPSFAPNATNVITGVGTVATFTVAPDATPGAYDITVCAIMEADPDDTCHPTTVTVVVPAATPDFGVTVNPAAIQMISGGLVTTAVQVNRSGPGVGLVMLSVVGQPSGLVTSFETTGDNSVLTLNSVPSTLDGIYELTIEATNGPLTRTATLILSVGDPPAGGACTPFDLRLNAGTVTVATNSSGEIPVFVDRDAGFNGQVELFVVPGTSPVGDVLTSWIFTPNLVAPGVNSALLSFTTQPGLAPGARFELAISGASPFHEDPTDICVVPIVFEVVP